MTQRTILRKFGDSLGIILPKSVLHSPDLEEGDELYVTATPERLLLIPYDSEFVDALEDRREFMRTHQTTYERLP